MLKLFDKDEKYDFNFSRILLLVSNSILIFCVTILFIIRFNRLVFSVSWNLHVLLHFFMISSNVNDITSQFSFATTNNSLLLVMGKNTSPNISFSFSVSIIVLFPFTSYLIKSAFPDKSEAKRS